MAAPEVVVGTLSVIFGADASPLARASATAQAQMRALERTTANVTARMKAAFLAVAGPAAIGYLIKSQIDAVSVQKDFASRIGSSIDGVVVLGRAAEMSGLSIEEATKAAERMNRTVGKAMRDPTGEAADAFKRLGINVGEFSKLDVDRRMELVAQRVKELGLNSAQTADFLGQMGIRGGKLANLFENGGRAIAEAREQVEAFGLSVGDVGGAKIEAAGDALDVFKQAGIGVGRQLALHLSPYIIQASKDFIEMAKQGKGIGPSVESGVETAMNALGPFLDVLAKLRADSDKPLITIVPGSIADKAVSAIKNWVGEASNIPEVYKGLIMSDEEYRKQTGKELPSVAFKKWREEARATAQTEAEIEAARLAQRNEGAKNLQNLSAKEVEGMKNKLLALRTALAGEGEAQRLHAEKQEKEAAELRQKGIISLQEYYAIRAQIEEQYRKKSQEAVWTNITSTYATEQEQLAKQYQDRLVKLAEFEASKTEIVGGAEAARAALAEKYAQDYIRLQAASYSAAASVVDTAMGQISQIMKDESNKGFTIMKAIAYATALVKGYEAVVSAWATGEKTGIPGMGAIMAGIAAAGTAAVIAKLAGVGQGSKGTVSAGTGGGGGGGGKSSASAAAAAPQQSMVVSGMRSDEWIRGDAVRAIAKEIIAFQNNGGKVILQ